MLDRELVERLQRALLKTGLKIMEGGGGSLAPDIARGLCDLARELVAPREIIGIDARRIAQLLVLYMTAKRMFERGGVEELAEVHAAVRAVDLGGGQ